MKSEELCKVEIGRFNDRWRKIDAYYQSYSRSLGLSPMAMGILDILYYHPEVKTQKEICKWSGMQKQTVNLVIRNFWEQGYVELQEVRNDRRNKNIILTCAGMAFAKEVFEKIEAIEMELWQEMTVEEIQILDKIMSKHEAAFQKLL